MTEPKDPAAVSGDAEAARNAADEAGGAAPPISKVDRKKQVIAGILTIAVLVFVFVGVFPKFADYGQAWDSIQMMSIGALIALAIITVVNVLVYVFPYQAAMPGLHYGNAFVVRQTSFMISNVVPAGGAFGLGVQYAMLSGYGYGAAATTTAIGATSVWNLFITLGLPVLGVLILVFQGGATSNEVLGALAGLAAIVVLVGLFALVLRSEPMARRIGGLGDRVVGGLAKRFRRKKGEPAEAPHEDPEAEGNQGVGDVTASVLQFRDQLTGVVSERWKLLTGTSFLQQFCQFLVLAVAYYGIAGTDSGLNPAELFAAFALARLAGFIPVTPGGLGTVDAALVGLMSSMGADKDQALAADLLWRAASYFPQVFIGIITFLIWRKQSYSRTRESASAPAA
ncbi:MAG: lysylphosphatidylglycerol synthase transmembrane domain-containing protein [Microthrixaceae bacterium]